MLLVVGIRRNEDKFCLPIPAYTRMICESPISGCGKMRSQWKTEGGE